MDRTYWHKQTATEPLCPDLLWSRPENKRQAGKLLIIGGEAQGFAAPAEVYTTALQAGVGTAQVLLPDSLQKTVGQLFPEADFAPSTPSGSFSHRALSELCTHADWADGVLLAGDLGRNSETAVVIESFSEKYQGQLTFTKDAANYIVQLPNVLLQREQTTLVISFAQLQKLAQAARFSRAFTTDMGLLAAIDTLHEFTKRYAPNIVTRLKDTVIVAVNGEISTSPIETKERIWRCKTAAHTSVWWLQHPQKTHEALTTAILQVS